MRQTIADASPGDMIVFVRDLRNQTITLTSGPLDLSKDLTILGSGASRVVISGNRIYLPWLTNVPAFLFARLLNNTIRSPTIQQIGMIHEQG